MLICWIAISIPEKLHIFYKQAYNALSFRHDANKSLSREFKTKLSPDDFSKYFAEFCARSYRDECYDFDEFSFDNYFHKLNPYLNDNKRIQASDFRDDLIDAICLMFYEDGKYQFMHRSFQEYFCALCISKQMDEQIEGISPIFENTENRREGDLTLDLLYCMIPQKVEKLIILPFLQKLFRKCDQNEGFITFLGETMDFVTYSTFYTYGCSIYASKSLLYDLVIKNSYLFFDHDIEFLPHEDDFVSDVWVLTDYVYAAENNICDYIALKSSLPPDYAERYCIPEEVGYFYEIDIGKLLGNRSKYKPIIDALSDDSCGIKKEYVGLRKYMHQLEEKYNNITTSPSSDIFDKFIG